MSPASSHTRPYGHLAQGRVRQRSGRVMGDHRSSTLPEDVTFRQLVDIAKLRWRIERDYQELKQEVGLGHFEGRGWRGFHHHATLCIAAYGFLISERETIPPSTDRATRVFPQF